MLLYLNGMVNPRFSLNSKVEPKSVKVIFYFDLMPSKHMFYIKNIINQQENLVLHKWFQKGAN